MPIHDDRCSVDIVQHGETRYVPSNALRHSTAGKEGDSRAPFDRHAENVRPFKAKMRRPQLCPGIEKRDERPGYGIEGTEIASLPTIAQRAGQGEILDDGLATVLFGDDVIHLI